MPLKVEEDSEPVTIATQRRQLSIHPSNKCLLSTCDVAGTVLGIKNSMMSEIKQFLLWSIYSSGEKRHQTNKHKNNTSPDRDKAMKKIKQEKRKESDWSGNGGIFQTVWPQRVSSEALQRG